MLEGDFVCTMYTQILKRVDENRMKIVHVKFSDAMAAALEANCEATGRNMSDVIREAVSASLARSPASRDGIIDMVLNPFVARLQGAESAIATQAAKLEAMQQELLIMGFRSP